MWDWIMIKDALRAIVEIFILWVFLYQIYRAFHATRGARIMVGLFACFLALVVLAFFFQLNVISWILTRIFAPGLALALVVIFQPELRVGLAKLGAINHALLTLNAVKARGLECLGIVFNNVKDEWDTACVTNRSMVEEFSDAPILGELIHGQDSMDIDALMERLR